MSYLVAHRLPHHTWYLLTALCTGQGGFEISRVELGRVRRCSKPHGPGRVGRCSKSHGSGRVGSGQEVFTSHGSSRVTLTQSDPRKVIRPVKRVTQQLLLLPPSRQIQIDRSYRSCRSYHRTVPGTYYRFLRRLFCGRTCWSFSFFTSSYSATITEDHSNQSPRYAQKSIYSPVVTCRIWS